MESKRPSLTKGLSSQKSSFSSSAIPSSPVTNGNHPSAMASATLSVSGNANGTTSSQTGSLSSLNAMDGLVQDGHGIDSARSSRAAWQDGQAGNDSDQNPRIVPQPMPANDIDDIGMLMNSNLPPQATRDVSATSQEEQESTAVDQAQQAETSEEAGVPQPEEITERANATASAMAAARDTASGMIPRIILSMGANPNITLVGAQQLQDLRDDLIEEARSSQDLAHENHVLRQHLQQAMVNAQAFYDAAVEFASLEQVWVRERADVLTRLEAVDATTEEGLFVRTPLYTAAYGRAASEAASAAGSMLRGDVENDGVADGLDDVDMDDEPT